jgi:hypothetical protein
VRWNKSRDADMDVGVAFAGQAVLWHPCHHGIHESIHIRCPIGSVSDLSISTRVTTSLGAAQVMQEGEAVVPLLPECEQEAHDLSSNGV